jgi:hypothetical protein
MIKRLDSASLQKLSIWLENYQLEKWESRFAADVKAGKLNKLGDAADLAFKQGEVRPL